MVIAALTSPPALWQRVGAGYRVIARFVIWETESALQAPSSALFRVGDGWASAMMKLEELRTTIERLEELRAEYGRAGEPFEYQAVCIDRFGLDGYREQAEVGVTDIITVPWLLEGVGFDADLQRKKDAVRKFGDEVIAKF
jgi:hypothetical protein